jgi:hypothetical protein
MAASESPAQAFLNNVLSTSELADECHQQLQGTSALDRDLGEGCEEMSSLLKDTSNILHALYEDLKNGSVERALQAQVGQARARPAHGSSQACPGYAATRAGRALTPLHIASRPCTPRSPPTANALAKALHCVSTRAGPVA